MDLRLVIAKGMKKILNPPALRCCNVEKTSKVCAKSELNYVDIGKYTYVGNDCFAVNVRIGAFCSIADRCCIGGAEHPVHRVSTSPVFHEGKNVLRKNFSFHQSMVTPLTIIENDVWVGRGTQIKSGVRISTGAIIGMGSVVTKDVPPYEIWAGNPAHKIRDRFPEDIKVALLDLKWWEWSDDKLSACAGKFDNPDLLINMKNEPKAE